MLNFKGYYTLSKKPVEGRGLILEAYPENFLIFFQGAVLQIGENSGHIIATAARCLPAGHPVTITTLTVNHEPWSAVLNQIPASVLVSGELTTNHPFILTRPDLAAAGGVSGSNQTLKLDYAQLHELAGLHLAPRTNAEKLTAEIQALKSSLHKLHQAIADSITAHNQNQNPYRRDNLFASISELRKKKAQLGNQLERAQRDFQAAQEISVFFSGQLLLRSVFVD